MKNWLTPQGFFYNILSKEIPYLTIRTIYSVLTVNHPVISLFITYKPFEIQSIHLIKIHHSINMKLYFWPVPDLVDLLSEKCSSSFYTTKFMSYSIYILQALCTLS